MIENRVFPFVPAKAGEIAMSSAQTGADILLPTPLGKAIVIGVLAWISWRLFKGFRKNQKQEQS